MIKFLFTTLSGLAIGIFGTLYTTNWQEEKLVYELGETAKFGDVTYQNIRVKNEGWNPATSINIQLQANYIGPENIKASPNFELAANSNRIGGYDRIRRNELVTLSFAFKGEPITPLMLSIKSDRSIAIYKDLSDEGHKIDWAFVLFILTVSMFFLAIVIPAYQGYKKRALEVAAQKAFEDGFEGK